MNLIYTKRLRRLKNTSFFGGIALLLLFTYIIYSNITWQTIKISPDSGKIVHHKMDMALGLPSKTLQEKRDVISRLSEVNEYISSQSLQCTPNTLVSWQTAISTELRRQEGVCHQSVEKLVRLQTCLTDLMVYLYADGALAKLLAQTSQDLSHEGSEDEVLQKQARIWSVLRKNIDSTSVDRSHAVFTAAIQQIDDGWQLLIAANKDKDQVRFESARQRLLTSYEALRQAGESDDREFNGYLERLKREYEAIAL